MLQTFLLRPLNRLLKGEAWASDLLKPHAGKGAALSMGGIDLRVRVTDAGQLEPLAADIGPAVCISLPPAALLDLQDGADQLTQQATVSGDAGFAETISLLLKHLRPDVGAALSPLFGDVIAHRVETGLSRVNAGAQQAARNLNANVIEYIRDEQRLVVVREELNDWRNELDELQRAMARLEKRIELVRA